MGKPEIKSKNVKQRKKTDQQPKKDLIVPKGAEVPLMFAPVEPNDFTFLHFYEEFVWLIEFSIITVFVVLVTNTIPEQFKWKGDQFTDNLDLSLIWVMLGVLFCSVTLIRLSSRYLGTANAGERSILVMFGSINFVLSLASLSMPSTMFDVGFDTLTEGVERTSKLGLIMTFSFMSALFGACFAFPGFRTAQMSRDASKNATKFEKMYHHGAFYAPLLIPLTFYPKLFRNALTDETLDTKKLFDFMPGALDDLTVDRLQLGLIVGAAVWRLVLFRSHLQSYIAVAKDRVEKLRKRDAKCSQPDIAKNVTVVWYYTLVAGLQYLLPSIVMLYLTCLWKSSTGLTFWGDDESHPWENPSGLNLPTGAYGVIIKYLVWFVSTSSAIATLGGYAFHSICDVDI